MREGGFALFPVFFLKKKCDNCCSLEVEESGVWPEGLLDAYIAMIPKSGGDATPLGQRPLCMLPVVYRIWASARVMQLEPWFKSWIPSSVFSAGGGA